MFGPPSPISPVCNNESEFFLSWDHHGIHSNSRLPTRAFCFFFVARYRYVHLESNTLSPLTLRDIWTLPTANEFSVATIIRIFNFLRQLLLVEWQVHASSIHFFSIVVPRSHGFVAAPRNVRASVILNFPLV